MSSGDTALAADTGRFTLRGIGVTVHRRPLNRAANGIVPPWASSWAPNTHTWPEPSTSADVTRVAARPEWSLTSPSLQRCPFQRSHAPVIWLNAHTLLADDAPMTAKGGPAEPAGVRVESNAASFVPGTCTWRHPRPDQCSMT